MRGGSHAGQEPDLVLLERVSFTYRGSREQSLKDVTLRIREGEFVVLTGPSGCGKTTLCRVISGLIPHFYEGELRGRAMILGRDVRELSVSQISDTVGFVLQNPDSQLVMSTVLRELAFPLENRAVDREEIAERVKWIASVMGLKKLLDRRVAKLSGGQKQKVAIASVLITRPKLLLLDEPLAYLSPRSAIGLLRTLNQLNKTLGVAIVLVEHRLDLTLAYSSRVVVMYEGRIVLDGEVKNVLRRTVETGLPVNLPSLARLWDRLRRIGIELRDFPISPSEAAFLLKEVIRNHRVR